MCVCVLNSRMKSLRVVVDAARVCHRSTRRIWHGQNPSFRSQTTLQLVSNLQRHRSRRLRIASHQCPVHEAKSAAAGGILASFLQRPLWNLAGQLRLLMIEMSQNGITIHPGNEAVNVDLGLPCGPK